MSGHRAYVALFRIRFRALLQYRAAAIAGICTQILFGLVRVMALEAFYRFSGAVQPMSLQEAVTYTWFTQAMLGMMPWNIEGEIGQSVRTGQVAYELARPLDLYWMWYARCVALRSAPTLLKAIPQYIFSLWIMQPPYSMQLPGVDALLGCAAVTLCAILLSAAITSLMNVSLFWTVTGEGIVRLFPVIVLLFSGGMIPLPLYPDWLQTLLRYQPFAGVLDYPARVMTGNLPLTMIPEILALQIGWTAAFVVLCRALMRRGLKRVTIAGG